MPRTRQFVRGPLASPPAKRFRSDMDKKVSATSRVGTPRLSSRIGTWWMNPRMADVSFNVGPPDGVQEFIPAHILVVAPASEVFSAMFLGGFDVPPTIEVPDGDPDAFKEMLRYIYTDRVAVTIANASGLLYLAQKYLLSGLTDQVVGYLKTKIGKVNFSIIYREAVLHEEMRGVWSDFIAQYPCDIFLSDDFVELDFDEMRKVAVKSLAVDTLTFYRKMLAWAQDECLRRNVDSSATNMRCALADAFKLIRFLELTPEEFEQGPGCDELLTVHEKAVLRHWHEHGDFRSLVDPKPIATFRSLAADTDFLQGSEGLCIINARKVLMDGIADRFIAFEPREEFSLEFETDNRIFFSGVACTFRSREALFTLSVDGRTLAASEPRKCDYEDPLGMRGPTPNRVSLWTSAEFLKLDSPVLLQAHRKYKLSVTANDAVGTQTQRVTLVVGRELGRPSGMTQQWRQNYRSSEVHKSRLVYFTFTYGDVSSPRYSTDTWTIPFSALDTQKN